MSGFVARVAPIVLSLAALTAPPAWAQATSGEITGTVLDRTGAAITGVDVVVTDEETGSERRVLSDTEGFYRVSSLPPGSYRV